MTRHVLGGHAEGESLQLDALLSALEGVARHGENLDHLLVGHRVAAGRRTGAVDHQMRTLTAVGAVIGVGVAGVDRQIIFRVGIHLVREQRVEAFRRLTIAFLHLRAELARPGADLVALQELEAIGRIGLPDLERAFFLEDAQRDRGCLLHPELAHLGGHLAGELILGLVPDCRKIDSRRIERIVGAAGKRSGDSGGGYKVSQAHQRKPVQTKTRQ
ncbi:hypothetical protein D3C87_1525360 [compost metagenome]